LNVKMGIGLFAFRQVLITKH